MLQSLNLVRNSMLCSPDMERSEPERAGQVEGGGERREEERKARQRTTYSAIFPLKAFVPSGRYLVI